MHGRVVEWVGSRIATGQLTGVLDLNEITQEFQVSRSLVRECLRTLAAKGMVQARQRTGTTVRNPKDWAVLDEQVIRWRAAGPGRFIQLQEALQVRLRIEPLAARLMAARQDVDSLHRLQEAAWRIGQAIAEDDGDLMIAADTAFHRELYLGSGNSILSELAGTVHACLRIPDFQNLRQFSADTVTRHQHLVDAIRDASPDIAEDETCVLMRLSTQLFQQAYRQALDGYDASSDAPGPRTAGTPDQPADNDLSARIP